MIRLTSAILWVLVSLGTASVSAQTTSPGPLDLNATLSDLPPQGQTGPDASQQNSLTDGTSAPADAEALILQLQAQLHADGPLIPSGLTWRIFQAEDGIEGVTPIGTQKGGSVALPLQPGSYIVHVSFGLASAIKKITVQQDNQSETIDLNAGGMQLDSVVGDRRPVSRSHVTFDIFSEPDQAGNRKLLHQKAEFNKIVRLNAGTYHVVSRYGESNAIVRADIRVRPGKLTNATIIHRAAMITLKFVNEPGGEALANTIWTVLTPGGDTVAENVGAFPTMILAEGDYTAVAKHEGEIFNRDFSVEAGVNRDVEVLSTRFEAQ
ncbi:hypothetical protein [Coralliovum pocilloporae]|uniref:hypothetical protein n=1 Tax=Coralliovum pocilloporae TaxID=3066369 RepID=UPI003306A908